MQFNKYTCVCVFSSHSFWTSSSVDVPAGVTQEEGHTGFLTHLLSAVRALIFLARRIQSFLSLVDREVEFCVLTILIVLHPLGIFCFCFLFFSEKNPVCRDRTHVPTCQKVTWLPLSYRGDRHIYIHTYIHTYIHAYIHTYLRTDVGRSGVHTRAQTLFGYFVPD